ncbi:hypothetical protein [Streptomyces sp. YPW6]|uniref:hypothetical protein n=1 Tax=Streptomyces sp. YPW6 TaxID=2840373 RepID=UPI003EBE29AE
MHVPRLDPQPPPDNMLWKGHDRTEKGAVYGVNCPNAQGARTVWLPDGQAPAAAPVTDPEAVARRAAASMKLTGPDVASPRAAGKCVVGMPMWMWADPSPSTFGPVSVSAAAGSVTASAKMPADRVGDERRHHGHLVRPRHPLHPGPGQEHVTGLRTPLPTGRIRQAGRPLPGRRDRDVVDRLDRPCPAPALGDEGEFTETRATGWTARIGELQVLDTN